jgi:hypothetical protein
VEEPAERQDAVAERCVAVATAAAVVGDVEVDGLRPQPPVGLGDVDLGHTEVGGVEHHVPERGEVVRFGVAVEAHGAARHRDRVEVLDTDAGTQLGRLGVAVLEEPAVELTLPPEGGWTIIRSAPTPPASSIDRRALVTRSVPKTRRVRSRNGPWTTGTGTPSRADTSATARHPASRGPG